MSPHNENFIDKTPHVIPNFLRNVEQDKTSKFSKEPILRLKTGSFACQNLLF
ncbi:hypothetical protein HMPREF0653_01343 [Prevotella disiens JCM 6334 = ATCC 29426]|uniref:Uncharacterized protein n=2 Tax=Prevotella disiens TaxID=28130 RepID=E1KMP3_9BACT|nr:hypothetical protein HMPREF9296_0315 [Prevotella disiens FB035-09AN]ERJ76905.1 hypothetical protein HMPREF0653_01343 [Prevotella disiens JCM 6334 = ATCC 29426]